jgi:hypothetical protein
MTADSPKAYFEQDDGHGRVLKVLARTDGKAAVQIKDAAGSGMTLGSWIADPKTAPDLCRAIFEACGQVPPVMLGRPELPLDGPPVKFGRWEFYRAADGGAGVSLDGRPWSGDAGTARQVAAWIAAVADAGGAEPGPDDGEFELAAILARHPGATFPELARAVLADGRFGRLAASGA